MRVATVVPPFLRPIVRRLVRRMRATADHLRRTPRQAPMTPEKRPEAQRAMSATEARSLGQRLDASDAAAALRRTRNVAVIVPIFNAAAELERCLDALSRHSPPETEFVLINDASTDPTVGELLSGFAQREARARLLENDVNLGFTATVNRGLEATEGDVVLLNSDAEVPPRWLANLRLAAYQDARIGTVTPLSDHSGAFSAPLREARNELPANLARAEVGRLVSQSSKYRYPRTPTGGGFCLYIKRVVLDSVGHLDGVAFPRGYGEENDLCVRASRAGWVHVVDDATYVFHAREASFGSEKASLVAAGRAVLRDRYPDYEGQVGSFLRSPDMAAAREDVRSAFAAAPAGVPPRVLNIVHAAGGGTPATVRDLGVALKGHWDAWILESDGTTIRLLRLDGNSWATVRDTTLPSPIQFGQCSDPHYRRFATEVLSEYAFELVHIRHLIKHPLHDVPELATAFAIPYLVSFHDYYFSCPTIHLLDNEDRFCSGRCTIGQGSCQPPMTWISKDAPHLKHAWVHTWRDKVSSAFADAGGLITTTDTTRNIIRDSLPRLAELPFHVVEHGRDLERQLLAVPPVIGQKIRILVPGHLIGKHKGVHLLRSLKELDADDRIELHLLGQTTPDLADLGIDHGRYEREEFLERVRDIGASFAAVLSPWGETYCHTLTESWAAGLPVIAADRGALRARVGTHGGGVLIDPDDLAAAHEAILATADNPVAYSRLLDDVRRIRLRTTDEMASDYDQIYHSLVF